MSNDEYSDDQLHLFVDNEINFSDRARVMEDVNGDEALACKVCELMQLKDTVRLAYHTPPHTERSSRHWNAVNRPSLSLKVAAASFLFVFGVLAGWVADSIYHSNPAATGSNTARIAAAGHELKRVVIHISSSEPDRLDEALSDAESMLVRYRDNPEMVQLEVVANAEGLALLRADASPYPERIRRLAGTFDNISFLACSRTIEKLHMRGIDVHLLPEARIIPGALEQIVDRIQDGWVYIRV